MPVIVYKTLQITAIYAQVRRIRCEACFAPYAYLAVGTHTAQTMGLPVVSSDQGMREEVSRQLTRALEAVGKRPRLGQGMCPHCQRYQGWMVRAAWLRTWPKGLLVGALVGGLAGLGLLCAAMLAMTQEPKLPAAFVLGPTVLGVVGGAVWAQRHGLSGDPYTGMVDSRAMTLEHLADFKAQCKERDFDPALAWYSMTGGVFDDRFPVAALPELDASGL